MAAGTTTLVILGATGDLTRRLLLPALYRLHTLDLIGDLRIVGYALEKWPHERFLRQVCSALKQFVPTFDCVQWQSFRERLDYRYGELEAGQVGVLEELMAPGTLFYLALPPALFGVAADALAAAGFAHAPRGGWRRLVVEKPFGSDLASAQKLRTRMHAHWQESQILRIDHFLGKETTQNLMVFRFANRFLEPVWNAQHIEQVQITYAETLGVEKRAGYYDHAGALRDMLQNHLMQLFSLAAIEPLSVWDAEVLRDHKVEVLRSVKGLSMRTVDKHAVRGQYVAGRFARRKLRAYRDEPGVADDSRTETFAALRLEIDSWRWQGVPFYLRSGKRMASNCSEIAVQFKRNPGALPGAVAAAPNWMIFRIKPNQAMTLLANAKAPGLELDGRQVRLSAPYAEHGDSGFSAYEQLLMDALEGDRTHFLRFDEVEWAWRVLEPVLKAWRHGHPETYVAGSEGPAAQQRLLDPGHQWRPVRLVAGEDH